MSQAPPPPLAVLTAPDLHRWVLRARRLLEVNRERIDALNVFPVPDGDTGTNMYLTVHDALLDSLQGDATESAALAELTQSFASTMLLHARGNSGVIISQLLRGVAQALAKHTATTTAGIDGPGLAECLTCAGQYGWGAVTHPVAGTILSVVDGAAAAAATQVRIDDSLAAVAEAALVGARTALQNTPTQLESLARAGVVDAGGAGFVLVMEALVDVVTSQRSAVEDVAHLRQNAVDVPLDSAGSPLSEVMFVVSGCDEAGRVALRASMAAVGESVVVAGDDVACTVHVHTREPGSAIEAALPSGALSSIRISWIQHQQDATPMCMSQTQQASAPQTHPPRCGLVVCATGAGLRAAYGEVGAATVASEPHVRATPQQLHDAAIALATSHVILVPNSPDIIMAAHAARDLLCSAGLEAHVVAAVNHAEGLAAVSLFDAAGRAEAVAAAMQDAVRQVRSGEVVVATREAVTEAGPCHPGDIIGYVDGVARSLGTDLRDVTCQVVAVLVADGAELITLVTGEPAGEQAAGIVQAVRDAHPECEVAHVAGGQPVHAVVVGVE